MLFALSDLRNILIWMALFTWMFDVSAVPCLHSSIIVTSSCMHGDIPSGEYLADLKVGTSINNRNNSALYTVQIARCNCSELNGCGRMEIDHSVAPGAVVGHATTHPFILFEYKFTNAFSVFPCHNSLSIIVYILLHFFFYHMYHSNSVPHALLWYYNGHLELLRTPCETIRSRDLTETMANTVPPMKAAMRRFPAFILTTTSYLRLGLCHHDRIDINYLFRSWLQRHWLQNGATI